MNRLVLVTCLVIIGFLTGCSPKIHQQNPISFVPAGAPDYRSLEAWAAHPGKTDPSDKVPGPLQENYKRDTTVDVFFLHPTTLTDETNLAWNADLGDIMLNQSTDQRPILYQASAFNEFNVYAPRYRQAHYRSYFTVDTAAARKAFDFAYADVREAFLEFLKHNQGRPIIIASHSQGTTHAIRLLNEFFDGKPLHRQLVVAYVVGMRLPDNFQTLRMCDDSASTGCLVGWRTYREGYIPEFVEKETGTPMVTNPLTWKRLDNEEAPLSRNTGAVLTKFDKVFTEAADARIHGRILWVSNLNFPGAFLVRRKNLHVGDINLFYNNLRENARVRVAAYKEQGQL